MGNDEDDAIENDGGDIGIPLTSANYTPKIDSPVVHIKKFPRDSMSLQSVAAEATDRESAC